MSARILPAAGVLPPAAALDEAATVLRDGGVIGIPTDTVYGLAVDPSQPGATRRLFAVKQRPWDVVLPVLVADEAQALGLATGVGAGARRLTARWWPGPLTVVLARRPGLGIELGGDETTIGLRCPAHPVARSLAAAVGPLATTSANRHGRPPVTDAAELTGALGGVTLVLDAGPCRGEPSTVVDCTDTTPRLLRAGSVPWPAVLATFTGGDGRPA